jgi:RHH-type proline utilization regulon transcriptional repressor/proline dehydrogenase/delta 1-pyrroline-5-carboxylate dehydrogenase
MIEGAAMELVLGDPSDPATDLGPIIDREAKAGLEAISPRCSVPAGSASLARPGGTARRRHFRRPAHHRARRCRRAAEGGVRAVLHVVRWRAEQLGALAAAIAATGYGLTLGIHSRIDEDCARDHRRALGRQRSMSTATSLAPSSERSHSGGSGLSGTGPKAGGPDYLRRFALEQVVATNTAAARRQTLR